MLIIRIRILLFTLATTALLGANAQNVAKTPQALSLKQAQEYALKNNQNAKNASLDAELAKKKIWEITAVGLPQISAQANYQHLFTVPEMSFGGITYLGTNLPAGTAITADDIINKNVFLGYQALPPIKLGVKNNTTLDITVSQIVFSGEYIVGLQASKVFYQMSDQAREKTETDLKEQIANSYNIILVLQENKEILANTLFNVRKTLSDMREMNKVGFIEATDVDQIELVCLNLENGVSSLSRQVSAMIDLLKFQMGMPYENEISLSDNIDNQLNGIVLETVTASAFDPTTNINYKILSTSEALANLSLKREKSTYLPNMVAVFRHSEKLKKPDFDFAPRDVFQLSMNIPIFSSGQRRVKVQERELELQKTTYSKEMVKSGLQLEYLNAKNEIINAYEKLQNEKKNIELTKRIYEKTLAKFNVGMSSSMDISTAQNQYLTAQGNYYSSVLALLNAKTKLDKLTNKQ